MEKIFVFGNPLVKEDSLALKVAERLKGKVNGIEFEAVQSLDEIKKTEGLYIMDVALGLEKVELVEDLDCLEARQPVSGHDFDLALELKMLKKVGRIGSVKIIAIPVGYELEKAVLEVKAVLEKKG